jgi:hypothetical protein
VVWCVQPVYWVVVYKVRGAVTMNDLWRTNNAKTLSLSPS